MTSPKLVSKVRDLIGLVRDYYALSASNRQSARELIRNGFGMHGEAFRFCEDGLCSIHNADFLSEKRFSRAYEAGWQTGSWNGWQLRWRAYVLCYFAERALSLGGDFVECGVNRGGNARMIIDYLRHHAIPRFYLLDTFCGFSKNLLSPTEIEQITSRYDYKECLPQVRETFAPFPFVTIIPGTVPETLALVPSKRVAFLSIDLNCAAPEIEAANYFWPRLAPGAAVVLDDYGFSAHIEQKSAFDHFAARQGVSVLSLPTGQGIMFKPGS